MADDQKKKFISEKIIGRDIGGRQAAKRALLAAVCGLLFGVTAAAGFGLMCGIFAQRQEKLAAGNHNSLNAEESVPAAGAADADSASPEHGASDGQDADSAESKEAESEEQEAVIRDIVQDELREQPFDEETFQELTRFLRGQAAETDRSIVAVDAVTTNTNWFEDTVETSETFAGVVLSSTEQEILILTTEQAARADAALNVTFQDGTRKEASVKQSSHQDDLAVIAVSKDGLGTEFLSKLAPMRLGVGNAMRTGDIIMAVGAPLGRAHSYDFGQIGYVGAKEQAADGEATVFYADLAANADYGTFVTNAAGELIGMVRAESGVSDAAVRTDGRSAHIVSISYLGDVIAKLKKGEAVPYLGLRGKGVSADMQYKEIPKGMYVTEVLADSPTYSAGIKRGDIVTEVNGTPVSDAAGYEAAVRKLTVGESAVLEIKRSAANGEYRDLSFTLTVAAR